MKHYCLQPQLLPIVCDSSNAETVQTTYAAWIACISDAPYSKNKPRDFDANIKWWLNYFTTTEFRVIVKRFKDLSSQLWNSVEYSGEQLTVLYNKEIRKLPIVGDMYGDFLLAASRWKDLNGVQRQHAARKFEYISTVLRFGIKASYEDPAYKTILLEKWKANEDRLSKLRFSSKLIKVAHNIADAILQDVSLPALAFVHASGNVAEDGVFTLKDKMELGDQVPVSVVSGLLSRSQKPNRRTRDKGWTFEQLLNYSENQIVVSPIPSKATSVYKDALTRRGIVKVPAVYMQAQQGVLHTLVKWYAESPYIARSITFDDQSSNAQHALVASLDSRSVTWDQSNASDNIHERLVKLIMPARVWRLVKAVRSDEVQLSDDTIVRPVGFAPMGSAVCFPIQSYMFLIVGIASYLIHWTHRNYNMLKQLDNRVRTTAAPQTKLEWNEVLDLAGSFSKEDIRAFLDKFVHGSFHKRGIGKYMAINVYGDDVILDVRASEVWLSLCHSFGFEINESKSFGGKKAVRESCGIVALAGYDVTPLMFKTPLMSEWRNTPKLLEAVIGLANRSLLAGYTNTRRFALRWALKGNFDGIPQNAGTNVIAFTTDPGDTSKVVTPYAGVQFNQHIEHRHPKLPGYMVSLFTSITDMIVRRDVDMTPTTLSDEDCEKKRESIRKRLRFSSATYFQRTEMKVISVGRRKITLSDHDGYRYRYAQRRHGVYKPKGLYAALGRVQPDAFVEPLSLVSHSDDIVLTWGWVPT